MSTWDDKPNDYEHAIEVIERLRHELSEDGVTARRRMRDDIEMLRDRCNRAEAAMENEAIITRELRAEVERLREILHSVSATLKSPPTDLHTAVYSCWRLIDDVALKTK
jgi:predicted RNase H-like nuclease (RuvC/YqgF family)